MDLQFEALLAPISPNALCGEDLAYSAEFDRIQEARREDDASIEYGEWQSELKQADWPAVVRDCEHLLLTRSKDLRLAAWLSEGLVKTKGILGLAQGMELTSRLIERFGGQIHPRPEKDDHEQRIGNISWLVMRLAQLLRQIPLTSANAAQYSLNDYESARLLETQRQRDPASIADARVTLEKFAAAATKTDPSLYQQWLADVARCQVALDEIKRVADSLFGQNGPVFSPLVESLTAVHERLQRLARDLGILCAAELAPIASLESEQQMGENHALEAQQANVQGAIKTRTQALEHLRLVAEFFRRTEPHSPVAYLADKAAQWGDMPLHVWLRSVMKDQSSLAHLEELLGMEGQAVHE